MLKASQAGSCIYVNLQLNFMWTSCDTRCLSGDLLQRGFMCRSSRIWTLSESDVAIYVIDAVEFFLPDIVTFWTRLRVERRVNL